MSIPLTPSLSELSREKKEVLKLGGFCSGESIKKEMGFYRFWPVVSQAANFSLVCISLGVVRSPRIRT